MREVWTESATAQVDRRPGVVDVFSRFRFSSGPRHTWEYVQDQGKAPEVPRRATFLATASFSGEDGDSLDSGLAGVGIIAAWFAGGICDFGILNWLTSEVCCGPPPQRTGTLGRA